MRVRLRHKSKPNNYTESCMINEADRWRGRNVWYLRIWHGRLVTAEEAIGDNRKVTSSILIHKIKKSI